MEQKKREQSVAAFFAARLDELAAMPACLESVYRATIVTSGATVVYAPATTGHVGKKFTGAALQERVATVAANVQAKLGVGNGEGRVILKLANYDGWIEIFWGLVQAGYVPVLLATNLDAHFVDVIYLDVGAKAIVTNAETLAGWVALTSAECLAKTTARPEVKWADEVVLLSSGTDGVPKTVTYDGSALCRQIAAASVLPERTTTIVYPETCGKFNILAWLPFSHVFGYVAVLLWYTFFGAHLIVPERLDFASVSTVCNQYAVTHVFAVPQFWNVLAGKFKRLYAACSPKERASVDKAQCDNLTSVDGSIATCGALKRIKRQLLGNEIVYCISGGSDLSQETAATVNAIGYPLYNGYGMTETGVTAVETTPDAHARLQGRIGMPMAGVTYVVGADGALRIETVYLPKEIRAVGGEAQVGVDHVDSGDVVRFDPRHGYEILGRAKRIVVTDGGEKLIPSEIRNAYGNVPHARESAVECVATPAGVDVVMHVYADGVLDAAEAAEIYAYLRKVGACIPPQKRVTKVALHQAGADGLKEKTLQGDAVAIDAGPDAAYDEGVVEIADRVRAIVADVSGIDKEKILPKSQFLFELGVTSMQLFEIVMLVEKEYGVHFDPSVYNGCATVMDLVFGIKERL